MVELNGSKCYIYTRVSTAIQVDGYSLEAQENTLNDYARCNHMVVVRKYSDEGASGKNISGRVRFQEMLNDIIADRDHVSYVLVFKLSRFGRNAADVLSSLQTMQDYGVNLIAVADSINSAAESGKLLISVMSAVAEIERENIRTQTWSGRVQKARSGGWNGGFAPYGYALVNGNLEVQEDEAEIIRIIYEKYAKTMMGVNGVASWLNNHGYKKNLRGNGTLEAFSTSFVKGVLDNPVYTGSIAYGRRKSEKIQGAHNEYHIVKQGEYPVYEGKHEAIISDELWEAAQAKRHETGHKAEKLEKEHEYILSGLVRCPGCGAPMYGIPCRKKRKDGTPYPVSYSYICRHKASYSGHSCNWRRQVACKKIDQAVESVIVSLVRDDHFSDALREKIGEAIDISELETELAHWQKSLRQAENTQRRLEAQLDGLDIDDPQYERKYESLNRRLDGAFELTASSEKKISEVKIQIDGVKRDKLTRDSVYESLIVFERVYSQATDYEKKMLMQSLIDRIELYPEQQEGGQWVKEIHFNFAVCYDGGFVDIISPPHQETPETVCLLSKLTNVRQTIDVKLEMSELDVTSAETKATYDEIKAYVLEQTGLNVSTLYIAQVKQKYGLIERDCYNHGEGKSRTPQCPPEKEAAITEALKYFGML